MRKVVLLLLAFLSVTLWGQKLQDIATAIYDFESTNYADSSGNGHNGTATGTITIASASGLSGNYAETDGSGGDYIDIGPIAIGNQWTIGIACEYDAGTDQVLFGRWYGDFQIYVNASGNWAYTVWGNYYSTSTAPTGDWEYITLTYDNTLGSNNLKFYRNGVLISQHNLTATETNSTRNWQFLANGAGSYDWDGKLDFAHIFLKALDATTISDSLWQSGSPDYSYLWTPATATPPAPSTQGFTLHHNDSTARPVSSNASYAGIKFRFHRSSATYTEPPPVAPPETESVYFVSTHPDTTINTSSELEALFLTLVPGDTVMIERGSVFYRCTPDLSGISGTSGNKIVIMDYGSGDKPVISGGRNLTGGFSQSGNIWTYSSMGYTRGTDVHNPAGLLINGTPYSVGKYPDAKPFLTTQSGGKTQITDFPNAPGWGTNTLTKAQVAARVVNWDWYVEEISANSGNSITFDPFPQGMPTTDYWNILVTHYFLQNDEKFLNINGEWAYDDASLKVYYSGNLNAQQVEFPVTDVLMTMNNSDYYKFENIEFRGANKILINLQNSDYVEFTGCVFKVANVAFDMDYANNCNFNNNYFYYIHTNGFTMENCGLTYVEDNSFERVTSQRGMANAYDDWSAAVAQEKSVGPLYIRYNTFDTVFQAIQTHDNSNVAGGVYAINNLIMNYGYILGDGGAVYCGGDNYQSVNKVIRSNIFVNTFNNDDIDPHEGSGSGHMDRHVHGVYWDYNVRGVRVDSNLFINANAAIYSNRSQYNSAKANTFYNASKDDQGIYSSQVYLDQIIDVGAYPIHTDTFTNNLHVMGNNPYEMAYVFHEDPSCGLTNGCVFNWGNMRMDNNIFQDPFNYSGDGADIVRKLNRYNNAGTYNLSEWRAATGKETNSSFNPLAWTIDDVSVSASEFVIPLYNASKNTTAVSIGNTKTYVDINGTEYSGTVTLGPYKHIILFYKHD